MNDRDIEDTRQPEDTNEIQYCEYCNEDMEEIHDWDGVASYRCRNSWCPSKFNVGEVSYEIANHLVEVEDSLKSTQSSLKYVWNSLAYVEGIRQEREQTIETLEKVIEKLTQSQSNVVVRDTEYQITRMQDAIDYVYSTLASDADTAPLHCVQREWNEVKKILESYG